LSALRFVQQIDGNDFRLLQTLRDSPGDRDDLPIRQSGKMPRGCKADKARSAGNEYLLPQSRSIRMNFPLRPALDILV